MSMQRLPNLSGGRSLQNPVGGVKLNTVRIVWHSAEFEQAAYLTFGFCDQGFIMQIVYFTGNDLLPPTCNKLFKKIKL